MEFSHREDEDMGTPLRSEALKGPAMQFGKLSFVIKDDDTEMLCRVGSLAGDSRLGHRADNCLVFCGSPIKSGELFWELKERANPPFALSQQNRVGVTF